MTPPAIMRPMAAMIVARVGDRRLALPAADVAGILPMLPLWRPPTTPPPVAGFLARSGRALAVLDAARLLDPGAAARPPALYAHIVRLRGLGEGETGLLVDRVEAIAVPPAEALLPVAKGDTLGGLAIAMVAGEDGAVHLIDPARLLAEAERHQLAALVAEAGRRLAEWAVPA